MKITQFNFAQLAFLVFNFLSFEGFSQTRSKSSPIKPPYTVQHSSKAPSKTPEHTLSDLVWLYKNGSWVKYQGHVRNLGQLYKELGVTGRIHEEAPNCGKKGKEKDCLTMIGYKLFTDEPLYALVKDTTNVKSLAGQFNIDEFMSSWQLKAYLKTGVEEGSLYDVFLLETLGAPDKRTSYTNASSSFEVWDYTNYNLSITLKGGIATSFIKSD